MSLLSLEDREDAVIVHIQVPRLDMMMYRRFRDEMRDLLERQPKRVVIDLELASSLDSSAVGVLKKALDEAEAYGGRLILCNANKPIMSILRLAHMENIFTVVDTVEQALLDGRGPAQ